MVDGVYDSDPKKNPNAKEVRSSHVYGNPQSEPAGHGCVGASFCNDRGIPFLVSALRTPENIVRAVCGENVGTVITKD